MKKIMMVTVTLVLVYASTSFGSSNPVAKEVAGALESFTKGCEQELTSYCSMVTPGEGRIVACLYAYGDKLSSRCEHTLYDSMGSLNRTLTNLSFATSECEEDLTSFCSDTVVGEGRVLDCLKKNKEKVSKRCLSALQDVGWVE